MSVRYHQGQEQSAIRTDLGAIFVSMELSRSAWLIPLRQYSHFPQTLMQEIRTRSPTLNAVTPSPCSSIRSPVR
jgi:hypothetical protein